MTAGFLYLETRSAAHRLHPVTKMLALLLWFVPPMAFNQPLWELAIFILAGIVLGGFVYPIDRLPMAFGIVARVLPTSWAMSSVWESIGGISPWSSIALKWAASLLMSSTYLVSSHLLFKVIRKRITVGGTLWVS